MRNVFLTAMLLLAPTGLLFAQSTGTIDGRVTDPAGAAVPGASVTATNSATGVVRSTVTTAEGLYTLPALEPGSYQVKVEKSGFATTTQPMTVVVGTTTTGNVALAIGGTNQQVVVTTEAPLVEITQSDVSGSLATQEVQELPMLNRNFTGLVSLVPGARPAPILDTSKATMGASISVGGNQGRNLGVDVDGAENRDLMLGGPAMDYTLEGIQEFNLLSHDYGAQYARSSGGVLEIATKSGTNAIHGSAFALGRNQDLTAIDYFTKQAGLPKNSYDREQYGGSFGGPVLKNRWFYFGAIEHTNQDFVETEIPSLYQQAEIVANAVPSLGLQPAKTIPKPFDSTLYTLKTDFQPAPDHNVYLRWAQDVDAAQNDQIGIAQTGGGGGTPHPDLSSPNNTHHRSYSMVASDSWVISPNSVNQFIAQDNHYQVTVLGNYSNPYRQISFPSLTLGGYYAGGLDFIQNKFQLIDNFSHQAGSHAIKIGASFAWIPNFNIGADVLQTHWTIFEADPSTIVSNPALYPEGLETPGLAFLMFVGNLPGSQNGTTIPPLQHDQPIGFKQTGYFVQDDWRIAPNLTLNLGLRYDLTLNGFDQQEAPEGRIYQALKAIGNPYGALPSTPTKDFQPRVGLAWNVHGNGKDVLRAAFGIFRDDAYLADTWEALSFLKPTLNPFFTYINLPFLPPALNPLSQYVLGVGPLPPAPPAYITQLPPGAGTTAYILSPNTTDPYSLQFHVGYTHQFTQNLVFGADYTHIQGQHEFRNIDINPTEGAWDPSDCTVAVQPVPDSGGLYSACPAADQKIPYGTRKLAPALGAVLGDASLLGSTNVITTDNRSRYDEFLFHIQHRGKHLSLQASYTLSWAYSYGGIAGGVADAATSPPVPQIPNELFGPGEWGPTTTDERNRVVLSAVTQLPWGIQIAPILTAASARPYTLTEGVDYLGTGETNERYINPATGLPVAVDSQRGSPTFDLDFRVTKSFNLKSENRKFFLFAEIYNLTNRANFGAVYQGAATSTSFEQPDGYEAGYPTSRQLQLGGRFTF